jgi:hypothetical protein
MSYSQNIEKLPLREINKYLAEGAECKELLILKNRELNNVDLQLSIKDSLLINCKKENEHRIDIQSKLEKTVDELRNSLQESQIETNNEKERKKFWRSIAITESGLIAITIFLLILL